MTYFHTDRPGLIVGMQVVQCGHCGANVGNAGLIHQCLLKIAKVVPNATPHLVDTPIIIKS